jgi:hypothetical protein
MVCTRPLFGWVILPKAGGLFADEWTPSCGSHSVAKHGPHWLGCWRSATPRSTFLCLGRESWFTVSDPQTSTSSTTVEHKMTIADLYLPQMLIKKIGQIWPLIHQVWMLMCLLAFHSGPIYSTRFWSIFKIGSLEFCFDKHGSANSGDALTCLDFTIRWTVHVHYSEFHHFKNLFV